MKKFFSEFKEFIMKGNVMDLAVAVIIGAAFQSIVTSLVDDLISPLLGLFTQMNFKDLKLEFGGITLMYGSFITAVINFLIMAFVIFLLLKVISKITSFRKKKPEEPQQETTKLCPYCKTEINIEASRCPHCTSHLEK